MECSRDFIQEIFRVCCKLHNLGVDEFLKKNPDRVYTFQDPVNSNFSTLEIMNDMNNNPSGTGIDLFPIQPSPQTGQSIKRESIATEIRSKGFVYEELIHNLDSEI